MDVLGFVVVVLLGLALGSFITCVSWRIPKGLTFLKGRSVCPKCRKEIVWYDNVPVLSYVLLGGRCRNCRRKISLRYPVIEIATGLSFGLAYFIYSQCNVYQSTFCAFPLTLIFFNLFLLISVIVIDLENTVIPDELVFSGFVVNFFVFLFLDMDLFQRLFSGVLAASFLLLLNLVTKGRGMGLGDVKLALFGGLLLQPAAGLSWMFLSFMIGAVIGVLLIILGKAKFGAKIAFGPFLAIALIITLALKKISLFL